MRSPGILKAWNKLSISQGERKRLSHGKKNWCVLIIIDVRENSEKFVLPNSSFFKNSFPILFTKRGGFFRMALLPYTCQHEMGTRRL